MALIEAGMDPGFCDGGEGRGERREVSVLCFIVLSKILLYIPLPGPCVEPN